MLSLRKNIFALHYKMFPRRAVIILRKLPNEYELFSNALVFVDRVRNKLVPKSNSFAQFLLEGLFFNFYFF